jgi:glycosyltransferase involved in cell wall biosynthesis
MDEVMKLSNSKPLVSVVLSSFNSGVHLKTAVQSVINQSYESWELLLLDDGSTDGSIDVICALNDPRIRILSDGQNIGLAARLNQGIDLARGEFIARMDGDDICFPNRFELQIRFLCEHPEVDLVGAQVLAFSPNKFAIGSSGPETNKSICSRPWNGIRVAHPTWMARRSWYQKFHYYIPEYIRAEDQELLLRAMTSSQYAVVPNVLLAYRQGVFNFNKIQLARRSLLFAQWRYFFNNGQARFALLALSAYVAKTLIDCIATLPHAEHLFFRRMGRDVSAEMLAELKSLGGIE